MQEAILHFINTATGILWGPAMLVLLVGGGLFISFRIEFIQFKHFGYMWSQTIGSLFTKDGKEGDGTITPFQAVTAELGSTAGASNIVGVPVAIFFGGPGAIFWMWVTALVGMASKYAEVVLGVMYREKNEVGEYVGGPMYYLKNGLKSPALGTAYAFIFMLTIVSGIMVQANSAAGSASTLGISPVVSGMIITVLVGLIVVGGVKRVGKVSEKFVPVMASLYLLGCIIIIISNITVIPSVIGMIFRDAFTGRAAVGGFTGSTIAMALRWGMARGAYSNEAGMGSAPIAHAAAQTDHPVRQGLWGMFSVFVDTILICSMTAFVILSTGIWQEAGLEASAMTAVAFSNFYGSIGGVIVSFSILLFVVSTIFVILFYGEKLAEYLFGYRFSILMRWVYLAACFIGAVGGLQFVWMFLDFLFGLAVIPNMIGVLGLSGVVAAKTKEYFTSKDYYLKDIKMKGQRKGKNMV
ncbi:alanine or glycine:cation symporter, AGCS family [Anaerovirgula multivorans]|uniref:Alanine or glycine:cation symporter, AGCS family n=1 Tax=Anaerovirgula multivorans TaxID=312168 RepID=A0A239FN02_9FIRM|nr:sodium:alanine symporter family protein [Anaerovirgula multivorans]SNS57998.1 alanine or glycine:cation symporter, AGCS family [Anaerovirgula multivorans]